MIKAVLDFCRKILTSKIGYLLLILHLAIVIYAFSQLEHHSDTQCHKAFSAPGWATIAGRSFHLTNEPLMYAVLIPDLPAFLIGGIITSVFLPLDLCDYTMSWVAAISIFICASFQWQLIGFWLESFINYFKTETKN